MSGFGQKLMMVSLSMDWVVRSGLVPRDDQERDYWDTCWFVAGYCVRFHSSQVGTLA